MTPPAAHADERRRPSLVDSAEQALRNWLAPGRHRPGDRLPPEHEVAAMLGVSRGTLRTALQRLEESGEIVRRQGSGTFVGRVAVPTALDERLERLESYFYLAQRRGVELRAAQLHIERRAVGSDVGKLLDLDAATPAVTVSRVLVTEDEPVALMFDVVHPEAPLPDDARLGKLLERGHMLLDILIEQGLPIAYARTRVRPCLVTPRERAGKALNVRRTTAALELEEIMYVGGGEPVQYSRDLFAPGGLDVQVIRSVDADRPAPINAAPPRSRPVRNGRRTPPVRR